jgi:ligand-binding sensor domain-containing protein
MTFQHITMEQGLSQNSVFSILQDSRGFLWFGTEDGLNRYDGYNMVVYKDDPDTPYSLSHNNVRILYEDRSGTLWIGTKEGLDRYSREMDSIIPFTPLSRHDVSDICEDRVGELWIASRGDGLIRVGRNRKKIQYYRHKPAGPGNRLNPAGPCSNKL